MSTTLSITATPMPAALMTPTKATILIVEDDVGVARLERQHLERAHYRVLTAGTADHALALLDHGIDLILLDYRLPGNVDGIGFYAELQARGHDLPVILVTGFGNEDTAIRALRAGMRDFVSKSAAYLEYLPEAVERVLNQVRIEKALIESEQKLRQQAHLLDLANDVIMIRALDDRITYWNQGAERLYGWARGEALGRAAHTTLVTQFPRPLADIEKHFLRTGVWEGELVQKRRDGAFVTVLSRWTLQRGGDGRALAILEINHDITARKRAEERVRAQAALLDQAHDAILIRDLDDRLEFWNQSAERLYGWKAAEVLGQSAHEVLYEQRQPELEEARRRVVENGEWTGELRQATRDGRRIVVASRWTLLRDSQGRPRAKLIINTDVTERKKLELQYLRAQRMESLGTLAGGIAHDLNNVLTPILMAVELLKARNLDPTSQSMLDLLQVSGQRAADMVRQVLTFSRGLEGTRQVFSLTPLLGEIVKMLQQTFPKSIRVDRDVAKDLWPISADVTQMHQVVMNLCVNARDAMPQGGRLTLSARNEMLDEHFARINPEARVGPHIVICVEDNGVGIPPHNLERIFDPFFTTKEVGQGTGLGLSTVLGIVKNHGGFVRVYSDLDKGSRFTVYLPAARDAVLPTAAESASRRPRGNGQLILVIDDESSIREIARAILESANYRVITAGDGAEGLALYGQRQAEINAVFVDLMMPVMDGFTTIRALQKINAHVLIIAPSGLMERGKSVEMVGGIREFLSKPFNAEALLQAVQNVLKD